MVYYLKYRPQSLDDLVGQEHIIDSLQRSVKEGKLSHAYLFCGPRGVGKTSTARILAKMVNCSHGGGDNCEICQSITNGSNLDLIEIDAASNRGIDDIRELRERIKLSPSSLKKKVYIIDEVHMLTTEAFNALLKTLEEPPEHVLFIMATTEPQKIPATILSRVTRMDFKAATVSDLVKALKRVAEGEKLEVDDDGLSLLAKKADGSFRDGVKLLDQLSAQKKITAKVVEDSFKDGSKDQVTKLLDLISKKDAKGSLELLSKELESGTNLKEFLFKVMDHLRSLLLIKHGVGEGDEALKKLSDSFSLDDLVRLLGYFQEAFEKQKVTTIASLPLEIAVIESCRQVVPSVKQEVMIQQPVEKVLENKVESVNSEEESISSPTPSDSNDMAILKDKWTYILETVKPYNFSLEALLRTVKIDNCGDGLVVLKVPYSFHQRILETPRNRDLLESVLADVLGKSIRVSCVLDTKPMRVEELANIDVAADDEVIRVAAEIFNS